MAPINNENNYWMYSKHSIEFALLNKRRRILDFIVEKKKYNFYSDLLKDKNINWRNDLKPRVVSKKYILKKIGPQAKYQGMAMLVKKLDKIEINNFFLKYKTNFNIILIIDKLDDNFNLGSILRTAYNFGINTIFISNQSSFKESGYLASISSGALDKVSIIVNVNISKLLKILKKNNWWIVGLESNHSTDIINLEKYQSNKKKHAIVIGSEYLGLRELTKKNCDMLLNISMKNKEIGSLNVSHATAIAMYHILNN